MTESEAIKELQASVSSTAVKVVDWWKCGKCNGDLTRQFACCPYCQTVIDWSDEE